MSNDVQLFANFDVAEIVLYVFFAFFAGLILYLRREDRREGYPLETDTGGALEPSDSFLWFASPKTFKLSMGRGSVQAPNMKRDTRPLAARRTAPWPGAPIEPTGDPLVDGVGPAAYADRADVPDLMHDGTPKIRPMRAATDFAVVKEDADPRGFSVVAADGRVAGTVKEIWVDRMEHLIRFLEVELAGSGARKLVPMGMAIIDGGAKKVKVRSINSAQFANVPALAAQDQITLLEEEKVMAYFGGGYLYGMPGRTEALL